VLQKPRDLSIRPDDSRKCCYKLNDAGAVDDAKRAIDELVRVHNEWFLAQGGGAPLAIASGDSTFPSTIGV